MIIIIIVIIVLKIFFSVFALGGAAGFMHGFHVSVLIEMLLLSVQRKVRSHVVFLCFSLFEKFCSFSLFV